MLEPQAARMRPMDQVNAYGHSRSRTTSSNTFPNSGQPLGTAAMPSAYQAGSAVHHSHRPVSVNTLSTVSSMQPPAAYRISSSTELRRSISSRSAGTTAPPSSYVALLRKQKATVWCDRAQYEDPRIAAQQRAAKLRANLEVVGGGIGSFPSSSGMSTTGKVAAKIRHHGKTTTMGYAPGENHVGVGGVPMRLSATEVEAESSDEEDNHASTHLHHRRTGSSGRSSIGRSSIGRSSIGRSSVGSGRRTLPYRSPGGPGAQSGSRWGAGETAEGRGSLGSQQPDEATRTPDDGGSVRARSTRSGSSAERADNVTELSTASRLAPKSQMHATLSRETSVRSAEEIRRRGSVDDRTATLTSGRLFIANPD